MLQFKYSNNKVRKIIEDPSKLQKTVGFEIGRSVKKRLNELQSANNFNEYLTRIALGKPHPLEGDLDKCYGIHVTGNYRLIVEPITESLDMESLKECKIIDIKGVVEYHGKKYEWIIP